MVSIRTQKQFDDAIARGECYLNLADGVKLYLREPTIVRFTGRAELYAAVSNASAEAMSDGAKAYATVNGALAFAYVNGAKAYAIADGARACAWGNGTEAYACAKGARVEAHNGGRTFFDLGAQLVEAVDRSSCAK